MDIKLEKTEDTYIQTLGQTIEGPASEIYPLLSTTEGISSWFKELSFRDDKLIFTMEDGSEEVMTVLSKKENESIGFTWDKGKVNITLVPHESDTYVKIETALPFTFPHIERDFAGWQYQLQNIKNVYLEDEILPLDCFDFEKVEKDLNSLLNEL